jgi:hypothetical protein
MRGAIGNPHPRLTRRLPRAAAFRRVGPLLLNIMMLLTVVALTATLAAPASAAPVVHNLGIVNGRAT